MGTMIERTITVVDKRSLGVRESGSSHGTETSGVMTRDGKQGMVASSPDDSIGHSNNSNVEDEAVGRVDTKVEWRLCRGSSSSNVAF